MKSIIHKQHISLVYVARQSRIRTASILKGDKHMRSSIEVRNIKIGEGIPKICVPLVGESNAALLEEMHHLKTLKVDLVEWRMDYHQQVTHISQMQETLKLIRSTIGEIPLLATFRSQKEGGEREVDLAYYVELNKAMIQSGMVDMIDVELFTGDELVKEIVDFAHSNKVKVVMSNHDFFKTPPKEEIISRLCKMQALGADLPKIAVMPQEPGDVLTLLEATHEMVTGYASKPIITMSMAGMGVVSRLIGEVFGSAITFAAAKTASAPGQIPVEKLAQVLQLVHESK